MSIQVDGGAYVKHINLDVGKHCHVVADSKLIYEVSHSKASKLVTISSSVLIKNTTFIPFECLVIDEQNPNKNTNQFVMGPICIFE